MLGGVNENESYDIFMNRCQFGNLKDPGVYVDRESMRNSIIPKQNFMRTAKALVRSGEKEKAIELLDKCMVEFPDEKFSYDMYMIPFIEVYYDAGAIEKANAMTERVFEIYNQNINYYNRLSDRLVKYYEQDYNQALGVIQQLGVMAREYKQVELNQKIDSVFQEHLMMME